MNRPFAAACFAAGALVVLAYANHFENAFHFDDFHTITGNPYIRSLRNLPRFFTDPRTFSVLSAHQSYRPLVTTSLAIDYRAAHGPNPLYFHLSTFVLFLAQLVLMYMLYVRLMDLAEPNVRNRWIALMAAALYGVHPVNAETVNYVIQRAEVQSTLGVIGGLVLYICAPGLRRTGLYLLPVLAGMLAKPPAAMFVAILFLYVYLFEEDCNFRRSLSRAAPATLAVAAMAGFVLAMERHTFSPQGGSRWQYRLTQPAIAWHYFRSFFWPYDLTADSDMQAVAHWWEPRVFAGVLFLSAVLAAIWWARGQRSTRPIAFGLAWFLLALAPVAWVPLAEVTNDHRMYFPFVGLTLAAIWAVRPLMLRHWRPAAAVSAVLLALCVYATRERNEVWRSEESLWSDVAMKSPHNGRGLMNYGLTLMNRGDVNGALTLFKDALTYTPNYSLLHINIGIASGALRQNVRAESHFKRAIELEPANSRAYFFYARWLKGQQRSAESIPLLETALRSNPLDHQSRLLLLELYSQTPDRARLDALVAESLHLFPGDAEIARYRRPS